MNLFLATKVTKKNSPYKSLSLVTAPARRRDENQYLFDKPKNNNSYAQCKYQIQTIKLESWLLIHNQGSKKIFAITGQTGL